VTRFVGSLRAFALGIALAFAWALAIFAWRSDLVGADLVRPLDILERDTLDLRFQRRGHLSVDPAIALVVFDDRTIELDPDLFERRVGDARVIDAIAAAGAKVIGLDFLFQDRERVLPDPLVADVDAYLATPGEPPVPADALLGRVQAEVHGDDILVASIKNAGNVVLGFHAGERGDEPGKEMSRGKYGQVSPGPFMPPAAERVLVSHPMFAKACARMGLITVYEDDTGSVRDVPVGISIGPSVGVPLGVAVAAEYLGVSRAQLAYSAETGTITIGDRTITADDGGLLLDWHGEDFPTYSVHDLVAGTLPVDALRDKIVLVGFTHLSEDRVTTPFGQRPGVEVHATVADGILDGDAIHRASPRADALLTLVVGLGVALVFLIKGAGPPARLAGSAAVVIAALVGIQLAFVRGDLWVNAVGPLLAGASTASACLAAAYLQEGLQRRQLRATFAHYLSDDLVEELALDPSRVSLSGERRELTVLFTDIRSFTTFSEKLEPLQLAEFLRAYFTPMTRAVLDNDGYVDKYIGDAIMAIFGAPVRRQQHAAEACQAALTMHTRLAEVTETAKQYGIDLAIGAGINTGEMVVGNIGSAERFDYTVLGDAVNLGSRLEGLTKVYGVFCLVGPRTAAGAGPAFTFRPVDLVRVKGKAEPIEIFELCAGPGVTIVTYAGVERFAAGIASWRSGDFDASRASFRAFAADNPHDEVTRLYLERLAELTAPPEGWDGVFVHTKK
jgi:adenylate cyclase